MRTLAVLLPLAAAIAACAPMAGEPYGPSDYPPAPYPEPYPPYPQPYPYPEPNPPYPQPGPYPEPYPPQTYPAPPAAGLPAPPLDRTRWRIVTINNRPVPPGDYSLEFDGGRLSGRFGCNGIGATYSQTGSTLDAGPVTATRMACPDMSWETQGIAIVDQVMQVNALGPNRITLSSSTGTIELVRQ